MNADRESSISISNKLADKNTAEFAATRSADSRTSADDDSVIKAAPETVDADSLIAAVASTGLVPIAAEALTESSCSEIDAAEAIATAEADNKASDDSEMAAVAVTGMLPIDAAAETESPPSEIDADEETLQARYDDNESLDSLIVAVAKTSDDPPPDTAGPRPNASSPNDASPKLMAYTGQPAEMSRFSTACQSVMALIVAR